MESPILQTDDRLSIYPEIARAGCLVRSLLAIAEMDTGTLLSAKQILDAFNRGWVQLASNKKEI